MHKVDVCGEAEGDKLLSKLLRGQITLLRRIPCFENLLGELHVFELLKHLQACSFALQDPPFYVLAPKQVYVTEPEKPLLVALRIDVPHDLDLRLLREIGSCLMPEHLFLADLLVIPINALMLLLQFVYYILFLALISWY